MLTRVEVDGFKTFKSFALDVGPLLVILGPNGSGKSNFFDALRLLSRLAGTDVRSAANSLRGQPHELFHRGPDGTFGSRLRLTAEVLLEPTITDPWGSTFKITHSRIRYSVTLQRQPDVKGIDRLVVTNESATPILRVEDSYARSHRASQDFKHRYLKYSRQAPFLTTDNVSKTFHLHQDGHAGRKRYAEGADATVLSSITTTDFPHLYALREELRSWRFLHLEPAALSRPSSVIANEQLEPDGSNLASVLARIKAETSGAAQPEGELSTILADLSSLVPGVVGLDVSLDERDREWSVNIENRGGKPFSSRVASDGTLRVLALLTMLHDPKHRGLLCFEEPENGIHPARLRALLERLQELVTDPRDVDARGPLYQLIMNSHSPVVLNVLRKYPHIVKFADMMTSPGDETTGRTTRIRSVDLDALPFGGDERVSEYEVRAYLSTASGNE